MFDIYYYLIYYLVTFILGLPIVFSGLIVVALDRDAPPPMPAAAKMSDLLSAITANKDNSDKLRAIYKTFTTKFKKCEKSSPDYNTWLDIIYNLSVNQNALEAEEVAKFRDMLEDDNPDSKSEIRQKIGTALQQREKK